jgi:hypothetical protein
LQFVKTIGLSALLLLSPLAAESDSNVVSTAPPPPLESNDDLIPITSKSFRSSPNDKEVLKLDISTKLSTELDWAASIRSISYPMAAARSAGSSRSRRGGVWPIALSLLVPGAGEIYMGYYKRGAALVAGEILMWSGYFYYHGKGLDERKEYERFADTHWTIDNWRLNHPDAYPLDLTFAELDSIGQEKWKGGGSWPAYHPWIDKSADKQGYYEVIGKYDWFISGWSDFDPTADPLERHTDLRTQYRSMRKESNDNLKIADRFIYISIAARTFSLVQTIILSRNAGKDAVSGSISLGENIDLAIRAKGISTTEFVLEYNF